MKQNDEEKAQARKNAVLMLSIGFAIADRMAGAASSASASRPFDEAEAFVAEAERRGMDPAGKLGD